MNDRIRMPDGIPRQPDPGTAWKAFEAALSEVLGDLQEDEYLVIESKRRQHYVQFACEGPNGMRVEAVSNAYITNPDDRLGAVQHQQLAALGWEGLEEVVPRTTGQRRVGSAGNFYVDAAAPVRFGAVARLACATLRDIFAVPHPGALVYEAFHSGGGRIRFPSLRLQRVERTGQRE